jgi:hypothetical protein
VSDSARVALPAQNDKGSILGAFPSRQQHPTIRREMSKKQKKLTKLAPYAIPFQGNKKDQKAAKEDEQLEIRGVSTVRLSWSCVVGNRAG